MLGKETITALSAISKERIRQIGLAYGGDTEEFDKLNSKNDWVAYIAAYIGRAADKVISNHNTERTFRENMVKAGALCIAAIEAFDKGYCKHETNDQT